MDTIKDNLELLIQNKADIKDGINSLGKSDRVGDVMSQWKNGLSDLKEELNTFLWNQGDATELWVPYNRRDVLPGYKYINTVFTKIHFDAAQTIREIGFTTWSGCQKLTDIYVKGESNYFPDVEVLNGEVFYTCYNLHKLRFGPKLTSIATNAFYRTGAPTASNHSPNNYLDIIFESTTPPTFATNTSFGPIDYYSSLKIYVPDESVDAYKTATNWNAFADYINPISWYHPTNYTELEWLQTDGQAYINLGTKLSNTQHIVEAEIESGVNNYNQGLYGARGSGYMDSCFESLISTTYGITVSNNINTDNYRLFYNDWKLNTKYKIIQSVNERQIYEEDNLVASQNTTLPQNTTQGVAYLFSNNGQPSTWKNTVKIHSFKLKIGTTYIYDLIPVKVNGVGYMYDKVHDILLGNVDGGDFICGPEKTV